MTNAPSHSRSSGALAFFIMGIVAALHLPSRADPFNLMPELPNIRELCTASTSRTNACLEASLQYRCFNYGNFSPLHAKEILSCLSAVSKLVAVMGIVQVQVPDEERDFDDPVEKTGLALKQVLFAKDLVEIFHDPDTASLFYAARASLDDSVQFGRVHNLWDTVLQKSGNDHQKTLKFVAEAVQDVSTGVSHLGYLANLYEQGGVSETSVQGTNLEAAGTFINLYQANLEGAKSFSAYPTIDGLVPRVDRSLHPYLHHFYLPAFLASELKRLGQPEDAAFFAAFLLNTGYEIVKMDAGLGQSRWPFHDPKPFDPKAYRERLKKIYTGYVGALWGIGQERKAKSLEKFSEDFARDPYGSMKSYFKIDFNSVRDDEKKAAPGNRAPLYYRYLWSR